MAKPAKKTKKSTRPDYCVALYKLGAEDAQGPELRAVLKELGIPARTVAVERLNDPVGSIAGLVGFRPSLAAFSGEAPEQPFLLMCNVPNALIDKLLAAMRDAGVSVPNKAMVTKFNKTWSFVELIRQVNAERGEYSLE